MNRKRWLLKLMALDAGAAILACTLRKNPAGARSAFALLGMAWLWVGCAYHLQRYADIHPRPPLFCGRLLRTGRQAGVDGARPPARGKAIRLPLFIILLALAGYLPLAPLDGRVG